MWCHDTFCTVDPQSVTQQFSVVVSHVQTDMTHLYTEFTVHMEGGRGEGGNEGEVLREAERWDEGPTGGGGASLSCRQGDTTRWDVSYPVTLNNWPAAAADLGSDLQAERAHVQTLCTHMLIWSYVHTLTLMRRRGFVFIDHKVIFDIQRALMEFIMTRKHQIIKLTALIVW